MTPARAAVLGALAAATLSLPRPAAGVELVRGGTVRQRADAPFPDDRLLVCDRAELQGGARDDLFVVGGALALDGHYANDLWALGDTVTLSGRVADHARLFGKVVVARGEAGNGLLAFGGTVKLGPESRVAGGAFLFGEDVIVQGVVTGELRIVAQRATLAGTVQGGARVEAAEINLLPGAVIGGDLRYTADEPLAPDRRVVVRGRMVREAPPVRDASWGGRLAVQALFLAATLLLALPFLLLAPRFCGEAVRLLRGRPWKCALAGAVAFGFLPMLAVVAALTGIGLPLALLLAAAGGLLAAFAPVAVGLALGGLLLRRGGPQPAGIAASALALGLLLLALLGLVPGASFAVLFLVFALGGGAALLALHARERGPIPGSAPPPPLPVPPPAPRPDDPRAG